jgi:hypothetical protein
MRRVAGPVAVGAVLGIAWSASMRGYMAQLAGPDSRVTWLGTFAGVVLPGAVVGALLGWAYHRRGAGPAWLAWSPLLLAVAPLALPGAVTTLVTTGLGSGAIGITLLAVLGGWSLSGRGPRWARIPAGLIAYALVPAAYLGPPVRPELDPATPYGAWVATLFAALFVLLSLACAVPMRRPAGPVRLPAIPVLLGALCGLAWAAALRVFMSEVAGPDSDASWLGTFGWILAPGLAAGALLGWAEQMRRAGGRRGWRWLALSPLLFASVLVAGLADPGSMFEGGVGGGAIGVPVLGMVGGYALSGRGPLWGRLLCGALSLSAIPVWALVADNVGGPGLGVDTPRGAWAALLYYALLAVLALASAIPHRPVAALSVAPRRASTDDGVRSRADGESSHDVGSAATTRTGEGRAARRAGYGSPIS